MKSLLRRAAAALAALGVSLGLVVAVAAPASAGTACASGYTCLFDDWNNSTERERFFQFGNSNYSTWQWGTYSSGSWQLIPGTSINNAVDAVNHQWTIDKITFYTETGYTGSVIHTYLVGDRGFRNWAITDVNIASSHRLW